MVIGVDDKELQSYEVKSLEDFFRLLTEFLCGKRVLLPPEGCKAENCILSLNSEERMLIEQVLNENFDLRNKLNYEQFNEILLLIKQNRISKGFFDFFFEKKLIDSIEHLKLGISKFRLFAMLIYGNFRFAYKKLNIMSEDEITKEIGKYLIKSKEIIEDLKSRPSLVINIKYIDKKYTFLLGYLSIGKFKKENKSYEAMVEKTNTDSSKWFFKRYTEKEQETLDNTFLDLSEKMKEFISIGLCNTAIYLTWDYMDIYVATSMRGEWEFQGTYETINNIFNAKFNDMNDNEIILKEFKLRYFDPTQSYCPERIDKGLVEALMLKRASLCIYMAQETDTMGKDSELASTLAQSKPVIAFIPDIEINKYKKVIHEHSLEYFYERLKHLQGKLVFEKQEVLNHLKSHNYLNFDATIRFLSGENRKQKLLNLKKEGLKDFSKIIDKFFDLLDEHRLNQPFTFLKQSEDIFKKKNKKLFVSICEILAIVEKYNFDVRADLFKKYHPLAIQVDLKTGVANGVLVTRKEKECAYLIYRILTNQLIFEIDHKDKFTILREKETGCVYRVVTDNQRLTNSFWNFYLSLDS